MKKLLITTAALISVATVTYATENQTRPQPKPVEHNHYEGCFIKPVMSSDGERVLYWNWVEACPEAIYDAEDKNQVFNWEMIAEEQRIKEQRQVQVEVPTETQVEREVTTEVPYGFGETVPGTPSKDNLTSMGNDEQGNAILRLRSTQQQTVKIQKAGGGSQEVNVGIGDTFVNVGSGGTYIANFKGTGRKVTKATGNQPFGGTPTRTETSTVTETVKGTRTENRTVTTERTIMVETPVLRRGVSNKCSGFTREQCHN